MKATPQTHDYSGPCRGWGHDYCITEVYANGNVLDASGWGSDIATGDYLVLEDRTVAHGTTRYRVETIRYHSDPPDMWQATLKFAPRPAI